jgi:hypothetical protein
MHSQPSTPAQSINPAPAFCRGWIFPQPNLPAKISLLCGFWLQAIGRLSGFRNQSTADCVCMCFGDCLG